MSADDTDSTTFRLSNQSISALMTLAKLQGQAKPQIEQHFCGNCRQTNLIVVMEVDFKLNAKDKKALGKDQLIIHRQGQPFICPHCQKEYQL